MNPFKQLLSSIRTKVYVKLYSAEYRRVTGPQELLDSIHSLGGYMIVGGGQLVIDGGIHLGSSTGEITDRSVNGFDISEMELAQLTVEDHEVLNDWIVEDLRTALRMNEE